MSTLTRTNSLSARWQGLAARERRLVMLALIVIALALLWWAGLAPALRTLRAFEGERAGLQMRAQRMQQLQREAQALKALPRMSRQDALRALQTAVQQRLGASAQLTVAGDNARVTLRDTSAAALAQWLADARVNARATPQDARLTRGGGNAPGAAVTWSGTLSLDLPSP